ncbi:hypothetical protein PanWU01x14_330520 [Parasponia andersonii]|uniref:Uncharacterized protein n=1 Tax=Parasponia andersonii TaxID=3476 RepID=A0A2P5AI14_PARAD|nr:hypothetical protein PanWU01x14_330520 [Parasponia andersonii]
MISIVPRLLKSTRLHHPSLSITVQQVTITCVNLWIERGVIKYKCSFSCGKALNVSVNPRDNKCKILDWYGSMEIVADGYIISNDPKDLIPLGPNATKVSIDFLDNWMHFCGGLSQRDVVGSIVTWLANKVLMRK